MRKSHIALGVGSISCAIIAMPGTAFGLTCAVDVLWAPASEATGVPTNTLVWGNGYGPGGRLMGPNGEVPVERYFLPIALLSGLGGDVFIWAPGTELAPNTRYWREYEVEVGGRNSTVQIAFETGAGPDLESPAPPALLSSTPIARKDPGGYCGMDRFERSVELEFVHDGILVSDSHGGLGAVASMDDLITLQPMGAESSSLSPSSRVVRWASTDSWVTAGRGGCFVWPEVEEDRVPARFGVLDLVGNFSGWQEVELEIPSLAEAPALAAEAAALDGTTDACVELTNVEAPSTCSMTSITSPSTPAQRFTTLTAFALGFAFAAARRQRRRCSANPCE